MAQEELNLSNVGVLQKHCGIGVAEGVGCYVLMEHLPAYPVNYLLDAMY